MAYYFHFIGVVHDVNFQFESRYAFTAVSLGGKDNQGRKKFKEERNFITHNMTVYNTNP